MRNPDLPHFATLRDGLPRVRAQRIGPAEIAIIALILAGAIVIARAGLLTLLAQPDLIDTAALLARG